MFWRWAEGMLQAIERDPDWEGDDQVSISANNEEVRQILLENIRSIVGDDEELFAKCTPDYPVGGKRILFDDGTWLRALKRDNVKLYTDPIAEINETGLKTASGEQHDVDVLIYGTGYSCNLQGKSLCLNVGFMGRGSKEKPQFQVPVPDGLEVDVETPAARGDMDPAKFVVRGCDKQLVGQFAAEVRRIRPPEPYKGKGIRYENEFVRKKQGKAFASGGS